MSHIPTHKPHVESSQIAEVGYDQQNHTLAVRFKSKAGKGSLYHYKGVMPEHWTDLCQCESLGKHFGACIKGKFDFEKIVEDEPKP